MSSLLVQDIMSSPVVTLPAERLLPPAEELVRLARLRYLPVVDERGALLGLVTHREVLAAARARLAGDPAEDGRRVRDLMQDDTSAVTPSTSAEAAGRLLLAHRHGCLPVLDERGRVVGIVTERDYLRLAIQGLAHGPA